MFFDADIDIDVSKAARPLLMELFGDVVTCGSQVNKETGTLVKHQVATYFQEIPKDKITGFAAIPYEESGNYGYFKIDILSLELLNIFNNKSEINRILKIPPNWKLLEDRTIVERLFHIHKHFDIVNKVKPKSILELSDVLALIRPEKCKLIDKYLQDRVAIRPKLYEKEGNSMRKSHSIPYSMLVVVNMYLIDHGIIT